MDVEHHCMRPTDLAQHYIDRHVFNSHTANIFLATARILEREFPGILIAEFNSDKVELWRKRTLSRVKVHSYNTYLRHLRILFKHAALQGLVKDNSFMSVRYINCKLRPKTIHNDDIRHIIHQVETDAIVKPGWFWAMVIRFLLNTAIRRRQLVNLRWHHIDMERKQIRLSQEGSKNTLEWSIPITESTLDDLRILKQKLESIGVIPRPEEQVFNPKPFCPGMTLPELSGRKLTETFATISMRTGIRISPHRLRHTLGTRLGTAEHANIVAIQQLMGHASITSTRIYVSCPIDYVRQVLERDGFEQELNNLKLQKRYKGTTQT